MPVYVVTGKLGSGKTLSMVGRIREYVERGRPVASNIDLNLRALVKRRPTAPLVRLPDRPTAADLEALGAVHETAREELNGAVVLDEAATWLNARTYSDKGRQAVIDWFLHTRKLGWDVFLIIQNVSLLDKQLRDALVEYAVVCRRLDRIKVPLIGSLINTLTFGLITGRMPQVHVAIVRYGLGPGSLHADTWVYKGKDLYAAYQSVQMIRPGSDAPGTGASEPAAGLFSWVWYATPEEIAAWPPKPKPKLRAVALAASLGRDDAWRLSRRYVTAAAAATT